MPFLTIQAQESKPHRLDLALEMVRVNLFDIGGFGYFRVENVVQPLPGIMARYNLKRWAIRGAGSFSRNATRFDGRNCYDCSTYQTMGISYGFRLGTQYQLSRQPRWYALADLYARFYEGEGQIYSPWSPIYNPRFSQDDRAIGVQLGLGFQWKIYRALSLLTEGYFGNEYLDTRVFSYSLGGGYLNRKSHGIEYLQPGLRLHLCVAL